MCGMLLNALNVRVNTLVLASDPLLQSLQELVQTKLELAKSAETEVVWKHELYLAHATHKDLDRKMCLLDSVLSQISDK